MPSRYGFRHEDCYYVSSAYRVATQTWTIVEGTYEHITAHHLRIGKRGLEIRDTQLPLPPFSAEEKTRHAQIVLLGFTQQGTGLFYVESSRPFPVTALYEINLDSPEKSYKVHPFKTPEGYVVQDISISEQGTQLAWILVHKKDVTEKRPAYHPPQIGVSKWDGTDFYSLGDTGGLACPSFLRWLPSGKAISYILDIVLYCLPVGKTQRLH